MSVRAGHEWYTGSPGCFTDAQLKKLEGRWIACPDSTVESFEAGKGNVAAIIAKFKTRFPSLEAPRFVSACTKAIEGDGGLREVLIAKDAVWAGCKPPMGVPTARELGVSLPASIFGDPSVQQRIDDGKQKARETKAAKAREAKHGQGVVESAKTIKCDLPILSIADKEAVRRACFDKAWAQKRARDEASSSGQPFIPWWQQHKKQVSLTMKLFR